MVTISGDTLNSVKRDNPNSCTNVTSRRMPIYREIFFVTSQFLKLRESLVRGNLTEKLNFFRINFQRGNKDLC